MAIMIPWNQEPGDRRAGQRQAGANPHNHSESEYKCFSDGGFDEGSHMGTEAIRNRQAGEFDLVSLKLLQNLGGQHDVI